MNYRHAFHAGNFADCLKHGILLECLQAMQRKSKPLRCLDTHAGRALYDLTSEEALRTGEAREGIERLRTASDPALSNFLSSVDAIGDASTYPGSPALIRQLLRPDDALIVNDLHPEEREALQTWASSDRRITVDGRDATEEIRARTPFPEGRGLILIDPAFEKDDEFRRCEAMLAVLGKRFRHAVVVLWFPMTPRHDHEAFYRNLEGSALRDIEVAELILDERLEQGTLRGTGVVCVNRPFAARAACDAFVAALGRTLDAKHAAFRRLVAE